MKHYITSKTKSQTNKHTSVQYFSERIIPIENIIKDPKKGLKKLSVQERRGLSILLQLSSNISIYPSQNYIGSRAGMCRKTVNEAIASLCEKGLIAKLFRWNKTCIYRISDFITNPTKEWRAALMAISVFWCGNLVSYPQKPLAVDTVTRIYYKQKSISLKKDFKILPNCLKTYFYKYLFNFIESIYLDSNFYSSLLNFICEYNNNYNYGKRVNMEKLIIEDYIHQIIKNHKEFNFTLEQEIILSSYTIGALQYAFANLKGKTDFALLRYLCDEYCKEKNIKPNWRQYYQLCEVAGIDTENRKKPQKGDGELGSESKRNVYTPQRSSSFLELAYMNPAEVFLKQCKEMGTYEFNWMITKEIWWQMGVVNMVGPAFIGYCGSNLMTNYASKMHPDEILYKIDSLVRSDAFHQIQTILGSELTKSFLIICLDAVLAEQQMSKQTKFKNPVTKEAVILHQSNLTDFLHGQNYEYISEIVGHEILRDYILQIVSNWTKVVEW